MSRKSLLLLAALLSFLSGCGPRVNYKYRIAVIPKGLTHEFWQSIHRGAKRAASDLQADGIPVEILWDGPRKESDATEQIDIVNQKAGMGIQGLVLAPQDSKQMVPAVEQTVKRGIPVVIIDSGLDPDALKQNPNLIVKYVATDNYHGGQLAAQRLIDVLAKAGKEAPKVVLFRYAPGSESTEQREQGFLDEVDKVNAARKKAGKPEVQVISKDKYAGATVETAEKEANPLLIQVKDSADGIFAVNESCATGMLNTLRSMNLNKKIRLVAFDSSEPLLQAVEEGDVDGLIVQDPYRMGYLGVWLLVRQLEGDKVRGAGPGHVSTGEYLLTKENLHDSKSRGLFDPEEQAKRIIQKPELKK